MSFASAPHQEKWIVSEEDVEIKNTGTKILTLRQSLAIPPFDCCLAFRSSHEQSLGNRRRKETIEIFGECAVDTNHEILCPHKRSHTVAIRAVFKGCCVPSRHGIFDRK